MLKNARQSRGFGLRVAIIVAIPLLICVLFGWAWGALTPDRLSPDKLVNVLEKTGGVHPGYRRNHAKGLCVAGYFEGNGRASALSKADVFRVERTPVIGRLAIAGGNPNAPDGAVPVRSMALQFKSASGQEWRTGMNALPFFTVATPQGFLDQQTASIPDPATGKPDPAKIQAFMAQHPESKPFFAWVKSAVPTSSWASDNYNSLNAFRVTNAQGETRAVRWSMQAQTASTPITAEEKADPLFLQKDLKQRLAQGPLKWDLVLTLAGKNDPTNDASKAWTDDRQKVTAGTLVLTSAQDQADGNCRDINYDPLILPDGISGSDDPLLSARSAAYSSSFNRRTHEEAQAKRGAAL
jgi:catalase